MPDNYTATPVTNSDTMADLVEKLNGMMLPLQTLATTLQTIDPSGLNTENKESIILAINEINSALDSYKTLSTGRFETVERLISDVETSISDVATSLQSYSTENNTSVTRLQEGLFYWLPPVANFGSLSSTYPTPKQYSTAKTLNDNKTYRYEGSVWVERPATQVEGDLTKKGIVQLTNTISTSETLSATPKAVKTVDDKAILLQDKSTHLRKYKTSKDQEGIFTTVTYRRKTDGSLHSTSVLSGGISPLYTTRTVTFYEKDGVTVRETVVYTLTYDTDGVLIQEV